MVFFAQDFYRAFRAKEKMSFHAAKVFAMECFKILPVKVRGGGVHTDIAGGRKQEGVGVVDMAGARMRGGT